MRDAPFRHLRRALWFGIGASLILAMGAASVWNPHPRLIWNASASAPVGLWRVAPDTPFGRGDMVAARLAQPWRGLAARRHYLPANVPLIKRVAAVGGDEICARDGGVFVNDSLVATPLARDGAGRPMPRWRGCRRLRDDAVLLLMDAPASFDGRYFGPTARRDIIGKATPLWLR